MRLLHSAPAEALEFLNNLRRDEAIIVDEIAAIVCVTKSIGWNEAWALTLSERKAIAKVIKEMHEKSKPSQK